MKNETIKIHLSPPLKPSKELPPPNWSPTGNSGYWVWRDEKWGWLTDEEYKTMKEKELKNQQSGRHMNSL
jgi:hypothetical protein